MPQIYKPRIRVEALQLRLSVQGAEWPQIRTEDGIDDQVCKSAAW